MIPVYNPNKLMTIYTKSSYVFRGHIAAVNSVAVQPTGHMICSGSWDRTVRIWATCTA